ncbi:hypothetical protein IF2G_10736 [Cordyceps javanica]|nr:hypothetical protein IF2G_10736 [Cordyceps javanica]
MNQGRHSDVDSLSTGKSRPRSRLSLVDQIPQMPGKDAPSAFLASSQAPTNVRLLFITRNLGFKITPMGRTYQRTTSRMLPIGLGSKPRSKIQLRRFEPLLHRALVW